MKQLQRIGLAVFLLLAASVTFGATKSAAAVLAGAQAQAAKEHKQVMVIFHASWCGWCKKLDAFMDVPSNAKVINNNFVVVHLTVLENGAKKVDENAGGLAVMEKFHGKDAGLPFIAITDPHGKMLINSNQKQNGMSGNTGYPGAASEIAWYMKMLNSTAPRMSSTDSNTLQSWLKANAPAGS